MQTLTLKRRSIVIQSVANPSIDSEDLHLQLNMPPAPTLSRTNLLSGLRSYLEQFCQNLDINYNWIQEGVAILELSDETASHIDGPRTPGYTCKLALSQELAQAHKDAELFVPGSYRWDRFLEITRQKAEICRQYVVEIPGFLEADLGTEPETEIGQLIYEPHLLSHWRLSYRTQQMTSQKVIDLAVNLVTGHLELGYYRNLSTCRLDDKPLPFLRQAKRQLGFKAAYKMMSGEIHSLLAQEDPTWAITATRQLEEEIQVLESYYKDRLAKELASELLCFEKDKRIQELQYRSHPRVLASPFATALIYIPMISYLMIVGKRTLFLKYDPISGHAVY
jgi:hypothetical protein